MANTANKRAVLQGPELWDSQIMRIKGDKKKHEMLRILYEEEKKSSILPKGMLRAIAMGESNLHPHAESGAGAKGLMQFIKSTGRRFNLVKGSGADEEDYRTDPKKAATAARKYLEQLWTQFGGDFDKTAAAYNAGEGNIGNIKKGWAEGETPDYFFRETQQYVPKIRHFYKHFADDPEGATLPKEREWLAWGAPLPTKKKGTQIATSDKVGKGLGVNAAPTPKLYNEDKKGLAPATPRQYATDGTSRMPQQGEIAFQQPARSELQQGIADFKAREAAQGGTPLYGERTYAPNSTLGTPSELQNALRNFDYAANAPEAAPVRGLSATPPMEPQRSASMAAGETFTAGPVTQPYRGQQVPSNIFTPDSSTYLQAAPPPLAPQRPSSYVEQNPSRDVFNSYAVQQPMPTYDSGRYNPIPSAPMYQGRMVEQPAPRAMEPFTPRSTYAEQQVPRDILTPRPETYFRPAPETPMAPQGRSMYAEQAVPSNIFTPNSDAYYRPAPPAPSYDSGNYQAASDVPADVFRRYSVQQPAPGRVSMSFPPPPQPPGNYTPVPAPQIFNGQMVQQPAPIAPSSRFGSYYGSPYEAQQQVRTTTPEPTFPEYKYDWYDQLMSIQQQPPVEDWQNQLDTYYMDKYGTRYQPELQSLGRSVSPPTVVPKSYPPQDIDLDEPAASALGTVNWSRQRR